MLPRTPQACRSIAGGTVLDLHRDSKTRGTLARPGVADRLAEMALTLGEQLSSRLIDSGGLFSSGVWRQLGTHLPEWVHARFDRSGQFLAALSATGFVGVWDVHSSFRGYDLLGASDWPVADSTAEELEADPQLASELLNAAKIQRDLYASGERSASAVRSVRRRSALEWGAGSQVLYVSLGRQTFALDVASGTVIASIRTPKEVSRLCVAPDTSSVVLLGHPTGSPSLLIWTGKAFECRNIDCMKGGEEEWAVHWIELPAEPHGPAKRPRAAESSKDATDGRRNSFHLFGCQRSSGPLVLRVDLSEVEWCRVLWRGVAFFRDRDCPCISANATCTTLAVSTRTEVWMVRGSGCARVVAEPVDAGAAQMAALCEDEPCYREAVEGTRLDDVDLSADGDWVFSVPHRESGLRKGSLIVFARGFAGGVSFVTPPAQVKGDLLGVSSKAGQLSVAITTTSGELWILTPRLVGKWAGCMYPHGFQLTAGNVQALEGEDELDVVDEDGMLLSRAAAKRVNALWEEEQRRLRLRQARRKHKGAAASGEAEGLPPLDVEALDAATRARVAQVSSPPPLVDLGCSSSSATERPLRPGRFLRQRRPLFDPCEQGVLQFMPPARLVAPPGLQEVEQHAQRACTHLLAESSGAPSEELSQALKEARFVEDMLVTEMVTRPEALVNSATLVRAVASRSNSLSAMVSGGPLGGVQALLSRAEAVNDGVTWAAVCAAAVVGARILLPPADTPAMKVALSSPADSIPWGEGPVPPTGKKSK
jgi:hypothetical protein